MAKVLFIIAKEGFKDVEFLTPSNILKKAGHEIFAVSNVAAGGTARGVEGMEVKIDYHLSDVKLGGFGMAVFVGGPGALENLDNEKSYKIARQIVGLKKPLGAICVAPVILAKAGVLRAKKATVWSSAGDQSPIETLKQNGADYQGQPVVADGLIITANGPQAAEEFGRTLLSRLG